MAGSIILTLALAASLISVLMYFFTFRGKTNTLQIARISYHVMAVLVIVAATLLLHAILTHQYQYKYVYEYSGSGMSLGLLISTFYAGQEGSFFLWALFTVIIGLILQQYSSKFGDLESRVMTVYTLATSFLLMMISPLLKNPFEYLWSGDPSFINVANLNQQLLNLPILQSFFFADQQNGQSFVKISSELISALQQSGIAFSDFVIQGKGLNPLLQNFWMQIHPPMLFIGFALSTVPFAFAIAALMKNEYKEWLKQAFPWVLSAAMVLGLAIMLGGYWAYGVLGWGGYWGWDPVENSSLVPWLVGVASIHTILIQKKSIGKGGRPDGNGDFAKTNLVLCILTYVLVLYSTFLTRSGILGDASVHSFTDPGYSVYMFLIVFMLTFTFLGLGMIIYRRNDLHSAGHEYKSLLNRELALFTGAVALMASAVIILVGTSAPIFKQSVETKFYNDMNLPLAILIGLLNGLSLLLKWRTTEKQDMLKQSIFSLSASLVATILMSIAFGVKGMLVVLAFSAFFTLFVNAEVMYKIVRGNRLMLGGYISHIGIAIFLLGVVGSAGFSEQKSMELPKGEAKEAFGYTLMFKGYNPIGETQKFAFNVEVKQGTSSNIVSPVMFFSQYNNNLMREPDILSSISKDVYVSPVSFDDGSKQENKGSQVTLNKGEVKDYEGTKITFAGFNFSKDAMNAMMAGGDFSIGAKLLLDINGKTMEVEPQMKTVKGEKVFVPAEIKDANLKIDMGSMDASGKVNLTLSKLEGQNSPTVIPREVLNVEVSIKPLINFVWLGVVLMIVGFIISVLRRSRESVEFS